MTELKLYKFVSKNQLEFKFINNETEVILFVNQCLVDDFMDLLSKDSNFLDDEGLKATIKDKYLAIEMAKYCEYYDISISDVFAKE